MTPCETMSSVDPAAVVRAVRGNPALTWLVASTAVLSDGITELMQKIDQLEQRIAALEQGQVAPFQADKEWDPVVPGNPAFGSDTEPTTEERIRL